MMAAIFCTRTRMMVHTCCIMCNLRQRYQSDKVFISLSFPLQCEFDENPIPLQDREEIKSKIVSFMTAVPSLIQLQIAESLSIISKYDFPEHWERLITELVEKMTGTIQIF